MHVFMNIYYNYQYKFSCIRFWNVFTLSQNWISPQYLSSDWWSSHVLFTRIHMLNGINVSASINANITVTCIFCLFGHDKRIFFTLNIICTQSLSIFIYTRSSYFDALQLLRFNCFVDVSNCFVDAQFNSFDM